MMTNRIKDMYKERKYNIQHRMTEKYVRIVRKQHSVNKITVVVLRAKFKTMSPRSKIVCVVTSSFAQV